MYERERERERNDFSHSAEEKILHHFDIRKIL
jgi:hypothetical protein